MAGGGPSPRRQNRAASFTLDKSEPSMHELSLCESITQLVVERAKRERIAKVSRVVVEIGVAAPVDAEALSFCFPIVAKDTAAAGAELAIVRVGLRARCESCGAEFAPDALFDPCPVCGGFASTILSGREMRVVSFDGA